MCIAPCGACVGHDSAKVGLDLRDWAQRKEFEPRYRLDKFFSGSVSAFVIVKNGSMFEVGALVGHKEDVDVREHLARRQLHCDTEHIAINIVVGE